jgi:hypothetical protein
MLWPRLSRIATRLSQGANRGLFQACTEPSSLMILRNFTPLSASATIAAFAERHSHHSPPDRSNSSRSSLRRTAPPAWRFQLDTDGLAAVHDQGIRQTGHDAALPAHKSRQRAAGNIVNRRCKCAAAVTPFVEQPRDNSTCCRHSSRRDTGPASARSAPVGVLCGAGEQAGCLGFESPSLRQLRKRGGSAMGGCWVGMSVHELQG